MGLRTTMEEMQIRTKQQIGFISDDYVLGLLRSHKWDELLTINSQKFNSEEGIELMHKKIGLVYDTNLKLKFPEIDKSTEAENEKKC